MRNDRGRAEGGAPRRESSRAGGEHLGGRPGEAQAHAEVRDPAELPAQAAATGDLPDRHAQAARLVGRLGEGAVRRGDDESGETGGDVHQVDALQEGGLGAVPPGAHVEAAGEDAQHRHDGRGHVVGDPDVDGVRGADLDGVDVGGQDARRVLGGRGSRAAQVLQVDEVQGAVAARTAAKDGEILPADDGAAGPESATGRREGEDGGGHGRFLS